ncbi:MAG: GntR family transcriptional regulator, partial [Chloroflexi bacterium]|nr:GntR family transcriptional regulator [Chloroflexota bacterium]
LLLEGAMRPGAQLPPERELMNRLSVSHATLREALKALAEDKLIEARPTRSQELSCHSLIWF